MNSKLSHPRRNLTGALRRKPWWVAPVAFLATVLALPVNAAIVIPDDPLTSGSRVAPNILLILDDSGSMLWRNVNNGDIPTITGSGNFSDGPDAGGVFDGTNKSSESTGNSAMYEQNYVTNGLYYNPTQTYQPWMLPDGSRMTGGTSYTDAYSSDNYVDYNGKSGGSKDLSDNTQTFYMPRDPANSSLTYRSTVDNYYRFQIPAGGADVLRAEYGPVTTSARTSVSVSPSSGSVRGTNSNNHYTASVPAGKLLTISIRSTQRSTWYWMYAPDGSQICNGQVDSGNTESCDVYDTAAGVYRVYTERWNHDWDNTSKYNLTASYVTTNACDSQSAGSSRGWINCTSATPTGRTVAEEKTNFATWYSYYRTRIKSAKGSAGEAFRPLGNRVRVGYQTIWDRNTFKIPVNDGNDGRFVDRPDDPGTGADETTTSRTQWYQHLYGAAGNNGTPLQAALTRAGNYFSDDSSSGPYGPESGSDQYSCRQNFAILTTDGYWNNSVVSSGNADGSNGSTIKGPKGASYQYTPAAPYSDGISNTLADVAMKYWKKDLRTESYMGNSTSPNGNNVPTTDADPAFWQHMVTFSIAIGLKTTRGWANVEDAIADINGGASWPDPDTSNPGNDNQRRIDDLLHAAVNGRGQFISASNPTEFANGLKAALASIAQRTSSFSNVATNSTSLNTGAQVFAASYTSGIWTGKVMAFAVSDSGGISSTASWSGSIPAFATRKAHVFTHNGTSGVAFPTSAQTAAMDRSTAGPVDFPVTGAKNADYIMGDASLEERNGLGTLRSRPLTVLGDIVGSSPAYVPKDVAGTPSNSTNAVYVGANDGMLHAFNADTGEELFAYVPGILNFGDLGTLSRGDYEHKYFVDGPITVSPRSYTGTNILVGALGRGGAGLYALNVSNPSAFTTTDVLWERSTTPGNNMGKVMGAPVLGMVGGSPGTAAAIIGNGVNSPGDKAALIILNLQTGAVIREIAAGTDTGNGLSAPIGVYGADGKTIVYVYAGDMQGNVWKFDLTNASPASWTATKIFHAEKTSGTPQPISGGLALAIDIATNKRWVFFGTGRYLTNSDANDQTTDAQSMYGVIDDGGSYTRADLTARSVTVSGDYRYFDAKASLPSASHGWYVDLPGKGERIVQNAQINGTFLVTASMIPIGDACEGSGTGFINAIDAFTGTSGGTSMFDLDNDQSTDDTGAGGNPIGSVNVGVGMPTLPVLLPGQIVVGGTGDGTSSGLSGARTFRMSWQRVSWREIRND